MQIPKIKNNETVIVRNNVPKDDIAIIISMGRKIILNFIETINLLSLFIIDFFDKECSNKMDISISTYVVRTHAISPAIVKNTKPTWFAVTLLCNNKAVKIRNGISATIVVMRRANVILVS